MNEEYDDEMVEESIPPIAPSPSMARQWSWNSETLLWVAGGIVAVSFTVWFLMSYTSAKARAIAERMATGDKSE
jgi:hypothetical protein